MQAQCRISPQVAPANNIVLSTVTLSHFEARKTTLTTSLDQPPFLLCIATACRLYLILNVYTCQMKMTQTLWVTSKEK